MARAVGLMWAVTLVVCGISRSAVAFDETSAQSRSSTAKSSTHYRRHLLTARKQLKEQAVTASTQSHSSPTHNSPRPQPKSNSRSPPRGQHAKPKPVAVKRSPPKRSPHPPQPPSWDVILSIVIVGRSTPNAILKLQDALDSLGFRAYPCKVAHSGNVAILGLKEVVTLSMTLEAKDRDAALAAVQGAVTPEALGGAAGMPNVLNVFVMPV